MHKGINDTLRMTVELQTAEIHDDAAAIASLTQDVLRLDEEIRQLAAYTRSNSTDSYNERTLTLEDAAKRTHLAIEKSKSF